MKGVSGKLKRASKSTKFGSRRKMEPEYCHVTSPARLRLKTVIGGFIKGILIPSLELRDKSSLPSVERREDKNPDHFPE